MQIRKCHADADANAANANAIANAEADANRVRTKNNMSPSPSVGDIINHYHETKKSTLGYSYKYCQP